MGFKGNYLKLIEDEFSASKIIKERQRKMSLYGDEILNHIRTTNQTDALKQGISLIQKCLQYLDNAGIPLDQADPGHGQGHLVRDYVNAILLLSKLDTNPKNIFLGIVSGTLHDIACQFIRRYDDKERLIQHPECGGILINMIFEEIDALNEWERFAIVHGIDAHQHRLTKKSKMFIKKYSSSRVELTIEVYKDEDKYGNPYLFMWIPRWIDRLDLIGPGFVGRHFLTLVEDHYDFDGKNFFKVSFVNHMKPVLEKIDGNRTMLQHIEMFHLSQSDSSKPYGKHDFGAMIEIRDSYNSALGKIIEAVKNPATYTEKERKNIIDAWFFFLENNIEPTLKGEEASQYLKKGFLLLDEKTQNHWIHGFHVCMEEYELWANSMIFFLNNHIPDEWLKLCPITDDVCDFIRPKEIWTNLLHLI